MDNETFTDLLAGLDESAAVEPEAPASAEVETAPVADHPPTQTDPPTTPVEAVDSPAAENPPVPPADDIWSSPDNPYLQQVAMLAQQQQALLAQQQAWAAQQQQQAMLVAQQQQQARYQELDAKWREIAAGDLEAYDTIRASVAELTQPYLQQAQALNAEAEYAKRIATATHIAATYALTPDQQEALNANIRHFLNMQSPDQMLADVEYRRSIAQQQSSEVDRLRRENEELRKFQQAQQQAQSRMARGADAIGAASGVGPATSDNFDSFDDLFNRVIGAA